MKGGFIWRFATFVLVRNEAFVIARNKSFVIARNEAFVIARNEAFVISKNETFVISRNETFVIARNEARMTWQSRSREPAFRCIFFARKFVDQKKNLSNAKKDAAAIRAMRLGFLRK